MTLFEQYELINYIANKDYGGNVIEPVRFNQLAQVATLDLFKRKFGLPETYQPGQPIAPESLDITQRITDETRHLKKTLRINVTQGAPPLQDDVAQYPFNYFTTTGIFYVRQLTIDGVVESVPTQVEPLTFDQATDRLGNWTKKPSDKNPVVIMGPENVTVYPKSTINQLIWGYISFPQKPKFDPTYQAGFITEGTNDVQYDWPEHLHMDLTRIILAYVGINMREEMLQQYAEIHKQQGI